MKRAAALAFVSAAIGSVACLAPAPTHSESATPEVSRRIIERRDIAGSDEELRLMLVAFPPGYSNPAHRHPVAGLCYVIKGTAETQYDGGTAKVVREGGSFQDEATKTHLLFRNVSTTDPLTFVCAAKIKKDQPYLLPQ